jgi:predicted TIM-barrel enzyme
MKKIFLSVFVLASMTSMAQTKAKTPVQATSPVSLKNATDSLSYAIGISVASFYKEQGVNNVNVSLVSTIY